MALDDDFINNLISQDDDGEMYDDDDDKEEEGAERTRMRSIKVYDHTGEELSCNDGIATIERSLEWIKKHRFAAPKLERCLTLLQWTKQKLHEGFYQ